MKELETLKITNQDGKDMEIKVIALLKNPEETKAFLIYTFDDKAENVDIYASIVTESENSYVLDSITDEEDWKMIQKAIQELTELGG